MIDKYHKNVFVLLLILNDNFTLKFNIYKQLYKYTNIIGLKNFHINTNIIIHIIFQINLLYLFHKKIYTN